MKNRRKVNPVDVKSKLSIWREIHKKYSSLLHTLEGEDLAEDAVICPLEGVTVTLRLAAVCTTASDSVIVSPKTPEGMSSTQVTGVVQQLSWVGPEEIVRVLNICTKLLNSGYHHVDPMLRKIVQIFDALLYIHDRDSFPGDTGTGPWGLSAHDSEYESDASVDQDSSTCQETLDSLIEAINRILRVDEESTSTPEHMVSFKKTKHVQKVFANHPEFKDIVQKHRDRPDKRFTGQKPIESKCPFAPDLMKDWLQFPSVDPAVSRLASRTLLSLSAGSSVKNPTNRQIDYLARSVFEASGAALFPSFATTWVPKAMVTWAEALAATFHDSNLPPEVANLASHIAQAGDFVVNTSIDATNCAAHAVANAVSIRRALWLRDWRADSASKKIVDLSALPSWSLIW
ncbi:unnamed protein product [Ranitomeya imitator]|uniref:Uncharacterized protein n=1 Tax=Ranitomeya imitator TaxID=111125 RepID=A0ABN9LUW3_9NEOB|nr:unnamed protein product [Ranitomeya imitator]